MDLYCKVYVHATSYEDVVHAVELATSGSEDLRTVEGSDLVVDVVPNDEHDEGRAAGGAGDFLYFPFTLDVEAAGGDETGYIAAVARLLEVLGDAGFDFVTAADFERDLPGSGRSIRPAP